MEKRIEQFVKAIAHKDVDGKINFPFNLNQSFYANGNDHLVSLPVTGSIDIDCVVRDDTITIDYKLLEVTRADNGLIKIIYLFNGSQA